MEVKEPAAGRRGATALAITVAWAAILILVLFSLSRGAVPAAAGTGQPGSKLHHTAVIPLPVVLSGASASSGGEFVYAVGSDVAGLDPSGTTDGTSFLVTRQIYETLVTNEPGGTLPRPGLAESWIVSSDGLTWTFRLRPGVKFHDGTPLDAAAVVYNFQRWWDPAHPFHDGPFEYFGFMFYGFKGDPGCLLGNVLAVGTDQVQLVLTRPYSPLPSTLAMPPFAIASPAAIQAGTLDAAPVGSGPFQFVAWLPGDEVRLEAYVGYWGLGPYLQSLVFRVIPDAGDRLAALQAGAVQGADNMPWSSVPLAAADLNLRVSWRPALNTGYLGINRAHPPLDNPLVRQAIAHALDKAAIVSSHYNQDAPGGQVATQLLPPAQWGRDEALVDYDYDPAEAEALLADAGYGGGLHTTLWVLPVTRLYLPNALDLALSMQEDLNSVGISTTLITEYDWATYLTKVADGEADLFMLGWGGDNGHPDNFFYPLLCDQYQRYGPRDDALCAALDSARVEEDLTMQLATYEWSSRRVHETLPLVPIGHSRTALFFRENVGGFVPGPLASESFGPVFLASDWVEVVADTAATLVYTDAQGSETVVEVPAGATVDPITLLYAPLDGAADVAAGFYAGHGFVLEAYSSGELLSDLAFEVPIVVTLYYTDADVAGVDEETLALRYWDGLAWSSDGITVVERDTAGNRLVVTLAHLSEFRLLARGEHEAHLPVVLRALP